MKIIVAILIGVLSACHAWGDTVRNGGDTVLCTPSTSNPYVGRLTLDYVLTYNHLNGNSDIVRLPDWATYKIRLDGILKQSPWLSHSWESFSKNMQNFRDLRKKRRWRSIAHPAEIEEKFLEGSLPLNCHDPDDPAGPKIQQTIVREVDSNQVLYLFSPEIMAEVSARPLQFSFLMVHEWLRDFSTNIRGLRDLNALLHSKDINLYSIQELEALVTDLNNSGGTLGACERSGAFRDLYIDLFAKSDCKEVTPRHLSTITNLRLTKKSPILEFGDLAGTDFNRSFSASGMGVFAIQPKFFDGSNLKSIDLANNRLEGVDRIAFASVVNNTFGFRTNINLSNNNIKYFEKGSFSQLKLHHLDLSNNELHQDFIGSPLKEDSDFICVFLDLSHNKLTDLPSWLTPETVHCERAPRGRNIKRWEGLDLRGNPLTDEAKDRLRYEFKPVMGPMVKFDD